MRIELDEITVRLSGHLALDAVSGEIASGEVTAVIGPSGAGKSTLLGVLAGLIDPDEGRVCFDGVDVTRAPPEQRRLGVVFQDLRLFAFMSGRANVGFGPRVARVGDAEARARVDEAIRQVHAAPFADRPAKVLSGGERQRIAIARALASRPRALLLDEPFASLDAELRRLIREDLRDTVRELGLTAVVVTHDREDAFALASRFLVVRDSRIEQAGPAAELYARPASEYVATLLGEASFVPLDGRDGARVRVGGCALAATGVGTRALLRPEQVRLTERGAGWPARVIEARFSGSGWRTVLDAGPLGRLIAQLPTALSVGDEIGVAPPAELHTL